MDALTVLHLARELHYALKEAIILRIIPIDSFNLEIIFRRYKNQIDLHISLESQQAFPAIHNGLSSFTGFSPPFELLARKYLERSEIISVTNIPKERIIEFQLASKHPYPEASSLYLILELLGRQNNLFFLDKDSRLLGSYKKLLPLDEQKERILAPNTLYKLPPAPKKPVFPSMTLEEFLSYFQDEISKNPHMALINSLTNRFTGLTTIHWKAILAQVTIPSAIEISNLEKNKIIALWEKGETLKTLKPSPALLFKENKELKGYTIIAVPSDFEVEPFSSISAMLLAFSQQANRVTHISRLKTKLYKNLNRFLERAKKKALRQEAELEETKNAGKYKMYGDLLLTYIPLVTKGSKYLELTEYSTTIPIDPLLSPQKNAQIYYKKYKKAQAGHSKIAQELEKTKRNIAFLEETDVFLTGAEQIDEIEQLETELEEAGFISSRPSFKNKQKRKKKDTVMRIKTPDGFELLVGKNRHDNEIILRHLSGEDDLWFHASKIPGSHVVIKTQGIAPPDATLEFAAAIAAFYSKGQNMGYVEIDYTYRRHVRKIPGEKAGMVTYKNFQTIRIVPSSPNAASQR